MSLTPKLCLCLTEKKLSLNLKILERYHRYTDLVELRVDLLDREERVHIRQFPGLIDVPSILTVRRQRDGGRFQENESDRLRLIREGIRGQYAYVDLEEDLAFPELDEEVRAAGCRIIRSCHDITELPAGFPEKIRKLKHHPGDLPKAAFNLNSTQDLCRIVEASRNLGNFEKILLGMGPFGFPTRVLTARLGSYLTYSSPPENSAAPGHTDPVTLRNIYKFGKMSVNTRIFGIIGNPVMHTRSPLIHNPGFERAGLDAVYVPFQVDRLADFFRLSEILGIEGVSVTVPHKSDILPHLDHTDRAVRETGACNTAVRKNGKWQGMNTDIRGFLAPLERYFPGDELSRKCCTVVGAGGTSHSIVHALHSKGAELLVLNRTPEKARRLADTYNCSWGSLDDVDKIGKYSDLIVQTTSAGMSPNSDVDPIPDYSFAGSECVFEIVYAPPVTPMLRRAEKAGCQTIQGMEMLLNQAFAQFEIFTGMPFPDPQDLSF